MTSHSLFVAVFLLSTASASYYEVNTNARWEYVYYPLNETIIQFKVKAPNDAHIIFTEKVLLNDAVDNSPFLQVVLGGWKNSQSAIRRKRQGKLRVSAHTPDILSDQEFRGFWIKLIGAAVMVGREYESVPFLSWIDPNPLNITHFGVATAYGSEGQWRIKGETDEDCSPCAPGDVNTTPKSGSEPKELLYVLNEACYKMLTGVNGCDKVNPVSNRNKRHVKKKRYVLYEENLSWDEAKATCERQGQKLASVRSKEEQAELEKVLKEFKNPFSGAWIAANDRKEKNRFVWNDGTNDVMDYNNWESNGPPAHKVPEKSCVFASYVALVVRNTAHWFVQRCSDTYSYVCEAHD